MAWNVPSVFASAAILTAAQLNQIRDSLKAIGDPWTTYAPTWSGTVGNGTLAGRYQQAGKEVKFTIEITGGTTTVWTGNTLTLPIARLSSNPGGFNGFARIGGSTYNVYAMLSTSTTLTLRTDPTTAGNAMRNISATVPASWTTGDGLYIAGTYEAA